MKRERPLFWDMKKAPFRSFTNREALRPESARKQS
jgi:hypothetical protein